MLVHKTTISRDKVYEKLNEVENNRKKLLDTDNNLYFIHYNNKDEMVIRLARHITYWKLNVEDNEVQAKLKLTVWDYIIYGILALLVCLLIYSLIVEFSIMGLIVTIVLSFVMFGIYFLFDYVLSKVVLNKFLRKYIV